MKLEKQLEDIVIRCKAGDKHAFEKLVELYHPRLKYYVRRLGGTEANVDDTLQDIWVLVYRKIHKLKQAHSFPIWLYRITRNKVYRGFRHKESFVPLPEESSLESMPDDEPLFTADDAAKLHRALNIIKPYHREVLTLYFIEQMSYKSIAEIVGCSVGTVRSRIYYAKLSLKKEMEK